jgi:hypothetical protein
MWATPKAAAIGMGQANTFMLDDKPESCSDNVDNFVRVKPFYRYDARDRELLALFARLYCAEPLRYDLGPRHQLESKPFPPLNLSSRDGVVTLHGRVTLHEPRIVTTVNCSAEASKVNPLMARRKACCASLTRTHECTTLHHDTAPRHCTKAVHHGTKAVHHGTKAVHHGTKAVHHGTEAVQHGSAKPS